MKHSKGEEYNQDEHTMTIADINENDRTITGTGSKDSDTVNLYRKNENGGEDQLIGTGTVVDGKYTVNLNDGITLKKGDEIYGIPYTGTNEGVKTGDKIVNGIDESQSHVLSGNPIKENDSIVTGKGSAGDKVFVRNEDGQVVGVYTINGNTGEQDFSIPLHVYKDDGNGNYVDTGEIYSIKPGETLTLSSQKSDGTDSGATPVKLKAQYNPIYHQPVINSAESGSSKLVTGQGVKGDHIVIYDPSDPTKILGEADITNDDGSYEVPFNDELKMVKI